MAKQTTRREVLKGGAALGGLAAFGVPEWAFPALAQDEELVEFTDLPEQIVLERTPDRRIIDVRHIDGPITPADQWFTTQHHGHPDVDISTRTGCRCRAWWTTPAQPVADRPAGTFPSRELVFGFECSGNRGPLNGLSSNGRWTGVPLRTILQGAGLQDRAREIVFLGADRGEEEVVFRGRTYNVDQQYGRSLPRDIALSDEPLLAYALNGEPLTAHQGRPLRLLVPGWYGAPNVKYLSEIHVQEDPYLGKWQARWYRTLKGEMINGELKWVETAITKMRLKSYIARVTKVGDHHRVFGVILHDGTPIESVEVRVDDGPWEAATLDASMTEKYSWKFFTYEWHGATPGEHTVTSRATDANGYRQPTAEELEVKQTFLEQNNQHPRTLIIT